MCGAHLEVSIPYLDEFTTNMHRVDLDSAVRPVAKICQYLIMEYYSKGQNKICSTI